MSKLFGNPWHAAGPQGWCWPPAPVADLIGVPVLKRALLFGLAAALLIPGRAAAETYHGVGFAGTNLGGDEVAAYAGAIVALPGGELGRGIAVRASLNGGRYKYVANELKIEADYRGAEAALVYQASGRWGWANFSAGPRLSKLELSPSDPANEREGTRLDLGLQFDGGLELKEWRLNWLSSVTVTDSTYLTQVALGRLMAAKGQTRVGAEAGIQGDEHYTKATAGSFVSTRLGRNVDGRIAGGLSNQKGRDLQPYVSAGITLLY